RQVLGKDAQFHNREPSRTVRTEIETRGLDRSGAAAFAPAPPRCCWSCQVPAAVRSIRQGTHSAGWTRALLMVSSLRRPWVTIPIVTEPVTIGIVTHGLPTRNDQGSLFGPESLVFRVPECGVAG